ncbi:hypothetical protein RASY3_09460 [Ruminococcus albus SY3]|uniref:Uncharacterized protein n=1 Tax=Ruminococcus albus SY3 TaxID=1341156 RepID=A0A011W0E6_RUMAL|nr:hypothetical protein [Ruminococcus albus]EXM40293.1 hypothetical protein RASY3_09460 [Ruminococcus albus SY3]
MILKNENYMISMTRSFWLEMNIPLETVKQEYWKYLLHESIHYDNLHDAIKYLRDIILKIQDDLIEWEKSKNAKNVIIDLYTIFDKCFRFYINQKKDRIEFGNININPGETYELNRNISLNVISAVNLWLDNILLFQNNDTNYITPSDPPKINNELFVDLYIYGLVSRNLSLLSLSNNKNIGLTFQGLKVDVMADSVEPIELIRYIPVTYFNTQITGNQSIFEVSKKDLKNADSSDFGVGFKETYGIEFIYSLRLFSTIMKYDLNNGKRSLIALSKTDFLKMIVEYSKGKMDSNSFYDTFVLDYNRINRNIRTKDTCIWKMGVNKFRHEIRPFICLNDNTIFTSYCALDQAIQLWLSYFSNGGMVYTNGNDGLTEGIEKRNIELSDKLINIIIDKLKAHYEKGFLQTEVEYKKIFGEMEINYGDYDVVYYVDETKELFLIESKFFSDSLTTSGYINDYEKLFEENGYYNHCRKRCDLVLKHPEKMKKYLGVEGNIKVHFLFISSKPLQIEFTDQDGIVSFPCISIFDKYLEGNLISEDGKRIIRPTITI